MAPKGYIRAIHVENWFVKETKSYKSHVSLPLILESGKMIASLHAREDDLYSGYGREDVAPDLDTEGLQFDEGFQVSVFVQWHTDKKEN